MLKQIKINFKKMLSYIFQPSILSKKIDFYDTDIKTIPELDVTNPVILTLENKSLNNERLPTKDTDNSSSLKRNFILEIHFIRSKEISWSQHKLTPPKLLDILSLKTSKDYKKIVITQNKLYHSNKFHFYIKN
jgi:hypothetical protein